MKIHGNVILDQPGDKIWPLIFDPNSLLRLVPGCQNLEHLPPDEYRADIRIGLAGVSGVYTALVKIEQANPPANCTFSGEIEGPTGVIRGTASFSLIPLTTGTKIEYNAQAIITGALAKLNPRYIEGVTNSLIKEGLTKLGRELILQQAN